MITLLGTPPLPSSENSTLISWSLTNVCAHTTIHWSSELEPRFPTAITVLKCEVPEAVNYLAWVLSLQVLYFFFERRAKLVSQSCHCYPVTIQKYFLSGRENDTPASHLGIVHNPSLFTIQPVEVVLWSLQMSSTLGLFLKENVCNPNQRTSRCFHPKIIIFYLFFWHGFWPDAIKRWMNLEKHAFSLFCFYQLLFSNTRLRLGGKNHSADFIR